MDLQLRGRVAVVGGASQGIGRAIAAALAAEGVCLALCARRVEPLAAVAEELQRVHGVEVVCQPIDVADNGSLRAFVQYAAVHFGRLDIAIANAGGPPARPFLESTMAEWDSAFQTNLRSVVTFAQAAIPHMQRGGWGRIVTVTSYTAKQPMPGLVLSNAIRPGVAGLVRSLATEFGGDGITVNNVGPGMTDTVRLQELLQTRAAEQKRSVDTVRRDAACEIPTGRLATPEEVAATVAWLCSEQAGSVTGQTILVDGGSYRGL